MNIESGLQRTPLIWLAMSQTKDVCDSYGYEDRLLRMAHELVAAGAECLHEDVDNGMLLTLPLVCLFLISSLHYYPGSPIDYATAYNHSGLVQFFLSCGADVNHQDSEGTTILLSTAYFSTADCAAVLLSHGADPTSVDCRGRGLLHYLARFATLEILRFFIGQAEHGAIPGLNTTREDDEGLTPRAAVLRRPNASSEIIEAVISLLDLLSQSEPTELPVQSGDAGDDSDDGAQFHDAVETHAEGESRA